MRRTVVSWSKFLFVLCVMSGLCVASLPLPTMAEPPRPTRPSPQTHYEGLEEWPHRDLAVPPTTALENPTPSQFIPWSKLVFQSYRDGNWEIYLADGDGSNQTRLTFDGAADIHPRLNRGATRIVFASRRTGNYEIFTMNSDGSGLTQLTFNNTHDVNPSWSPDGTKIAFQAYRDGQAEVYVMNADGSGQTRLTWDDRYDGEPAWSPDGTRIAFTSERTGQGQYRIWVMNADGSGQTQLSTQPFSENPTWSPDGSQIAYDADGNNDGWQELWLVHADGYYPREVYDPWEPQTDVWARSWSLDGRYVAFTRISFVFDQGNWYWTTAYLDAWDRTNPWAAVRLSGSGTDWHPGWQTADIWAPTSRVDALPAQSPGPFTVSWSGSDIGPSGIKNYDVQVKHGGEAWTDWQIETTATSASYPGIGGHIYCFRSRARDNAGNVEPWPADYDALTTVESWPPDTAVNPLPAYVRNSVSVNWRGYDPGGSGIQLYEVQYRDTAGGSWTDWQRGTTETSASFSGTSGHTYHFRSRGTDRALNVEPWPTGDGDASTTFYTWAMTSTVRDNRDTPLAGVTVTTLPAAVGVVPGDREGTYVAYVPDSTRTYTVTWAKSGYSSLPPTGFDRDAHLDLTMPPQNNVVRNWGFENGSLGPGDWLATGVITPVVINNIKHTGDYAVSISGPSQPFTVTFFEGFDDDFIAGRNVPNLVDPTLSTSFSAINAKRPEASGFLTLRDREIDDPGGEGGGFPPRRDVVLDFSDGGGSFVTFRFSGGGLTVRDGSSITFDVVAYGGDGGSLFKFISPDGINFTQVGDDSSANGSYSFDLAPGGRETFFRLQVGTQASIYDGVHVDHFLAKVVTQAHVEHSGDSSIAQTVTVPMTMSAPTLSFFYQLVGLSATRSSWFAVRVDNSITATTLFSTTTTTNDWTHRWIDLTPWAGQTITLTFNLHQAAGDPVRELYLDDITLGSAYPDLWINKTGTRTAPSGQPVVYTITYGNRGGTMAGGVRITDTLPGGLTFVNASPPPRAATVPLVWEVGDLPARSGPFTIVVTTTAASGVSLRAPLTNTVAIKADSPELETFNNTAQAATFIGYRLYLPTLMRGYYR